MPHQVSQPEAQPAHQHEAEDDREQRAPPERQLGVVPALLGFLAFRLSIVKISPHRPPNELTAIFQHLPSPATHADRASKSELRR
jgi:hypothetical protein